jgi:CDP-6-deoxy-D-xylo-4-hexulose-3-dehydrase
MICTNDSELYDLMKIKRTHGLARASNNFEQYANDHPEIQKTFLFVTDGYNFRNTELGAVLGISQLKRLDKFINIRRSNYKKFSSIINNNNFYPVYYSDSNSSFCFQIICKSKEIKHRLIKKFEENQIEFRPVVGGNLLRQPYLNYKILQEDEFKYADIIHENGVYLGNSQFVTDKNIKVLKKIIKEL